MRLHLKWALALLALALPVRAEAPPGRFTLTTGVATDTRTGLRWQRSPPTDAKTWDAAKTYCSGLNLEGTGWRLPSAKEFLTIVDETATSPAIDLVIFPGAMSPSYWSSTRIATDSTKVWAVSFYEGMNNGPWPTDAITMLSVRCVR